MVRADPPGSGRHGTCAVVTGAARGIGAAIMTELQGDGWPVIGVDLSEPSSDTGADAWVTGDVRTAETLLTALSHARELGGLGAWVNNAGIQQDRARPLHTRTHEEIDNLLATNLIAPVHAVAAAAGEMVATGGGGAIVNVSSVHGARPSRGWSAYAAAKAGLEGLTRAAAADYGPFGVRVNAVAPGQVLTENYTVTFLQTMGDARQSLEQRLIRALHPLGRAVIPAEVAAVVAFLLSPAASAVTGIVVPVDGGRQASDPYDALVAESSSQSGLGGV